MDAVYLHPQYLIRRKVFSFPGRKFHLYDPAGNLIGFSYQKAFRLKEDIRIYADEEKTKERLVIQARQIIDFSAAYDVVDATEGRKIGALRRRGLQSIVRDTWEFLDEMDRPIATLEEDSQVMAILRRFINIIPQKFHVAVGERHIARYEQNFNPFVLKLMVHLEPDAAKYVDPRLLLAGALLVTAVEGRQN